MFLFQGFPMSLPKGRLLLVGSIAVALLALAGYWAWTVLLPHHHFRQGRLALARDHHAEAARAADELEANGHRDHAALLRGEILVREGRCAEALPLLEQVRLAGPTQLEAVALVGRCLLETGNLNEAERVFTYLLEKNPDHLDAHRGLAALHYDRAAYARSASHCEAWANLDAADGRPYRMRGLMNKELRHDQEAIADYRKALARNLKDSTRAEVVLELAEAQLKQADFAPALETLATLKETDAKADLLRGEALRGLGRIDEARTSAVKALAADPKNARGLALQGRLWLDAKQPEKALPPLLQAVQLAPMDHEIRYALAQAHTQLGQTKEAAVQVAEVRAIQGVLDELAKTTALILSGTTDPELHRKMADLYDRMQMPYESARHRQSEQLLRQRGKRP
jgi:tetratricopeptide (TPR) repeat protein